MISHSLVLLGLASFAGQPVPPTTSAVDGDVLDFEGLPAGTVLSEVYSAGGMGPVHIMGHNPQLGAANAALIFDSSNPTGEDFDLGTPNEDFGGPGIGESGEAGSPWENSVAQGNVLIIAEDLVDGDGDGLIDDPDDADRPGSSLVFDFTAMGSVTMNSILLIDVEAERPFTQVNLFGAGGSHLATIDLDAVGDNGVGEFPLGDVVGVEVMVVVMHGSGAIDTVAFTPPDVCESSIGDYVWNDADKDGLQDGDEAGIGGVTVQLCDTTDAVLATTVTDNTGFYEFTGLCAGDYRVKVDASTLPPMFAPTACNVGDDDTIDNDCSPVDVSVGENTVNPTIDFGYAMKDRPGGGQGCTPGYWKQPHHFDSWPEGIQPDMMFSDFFEDAFPGKSLVDVLMQGGGGLNALGRHTVAALLNAESPDVNYHGMSGSDVVGAFNDVYPGTKQDYNQLKNLFAAQNEAGCPLN